MSTNAMTAPAVRASKGSGTPLVMVTAYDAPGARIADEAGVDIILVGDSVAMVVLGYEDTLQVTVDDMAHHVAAVARAKPRPLIVGDMPWMSYHVSVEDTVRNAAALVRAGAQAVKLEGGRKRVDMVKAVIDAEMPVMGHIGLTPQSIHALGGFKVQGKQAAAAAALVDDAVALADAGCFSIVLEAVPDGVARAVTEAVPVPTIGIGARVPRRSRHRGPHLAEVRASLRQREGRLRRRPDPVCRRRPDPSLPVRRGELSPQRRRRRGARPLWRRHQISLTA
jgi:3-methyl-2-oxobutanoate hydroxymethyltransferase